MRVGAVRLTQYAQKFGFGQVTGVELPSEEKGLLFNPADMRDFDLATMAIGQSIAESALRFVLVKYKDIMSIMVSTDLTLKATDIINERFDEIVYQITHYTDRLRNLHPLILWR
jgi:hypothetical protein